MTEYIEVNPESADASGKLPDGSAEQVLKNAMNHEERITLIKASVTEHNSTVVIFGDSITNQNSGVYGTSYLIKETGYFSWANHLLDNRFKVLNNAGVSGDTTGQMLARIQVDVIDFNPKLCIVLGGTNDLIIGNPSQTKDNTIANLTEIYKKLLAANITTILCTIPSSGNFVSEDDWNDVNQFISEYAYNNKLAIVDFSSSFSDVNNTVFPYQIPNTTRDNTHPTSYGAWLMGNDLAEVIRPFAGALFPLINSNNVSNNIIPNTLLRGAGGNVPNGVAPDGWIFREYGTNPDATFTGSVIAGQKSNTYQLEISNTGENLVSVAIELLSIPNLTLGDLLRFSCDMELLDGINVETFEIRIFTRNDAYQATLTTVHLNRTAGEIIPSISTGMKRVVFPLLEVPADSPRFGLTFKFTAKSGKIRIKNPSALVLPK